MKTFLISIFLSFHFLFPVESNGQVKKVAQFSTLTPSLLVASNSNIQPYHKSHFLLSTTAYLGAYMVTESEWKAALISFLLGVSKELVFDSLLRQGDPQIRDVAWNTLGIAQGVVFTVSLKF